MIDERQRATHQGARDELHEEQLSRRERLRQARDDRGRGRGAHRGDRDDEAGRRGDGLDTRKMRDVERNQEPEAAVDELRDHQQNHDRDEVRILQERREGRRAGPGAPLVWIQRTRFLEKKDERDQRERTHPGRHEERRARPEMRRDDAADQGPDRDAQELSPLHPCDRH